MLGTKNNKFLETKNAQNYIKVVNCKQSSQRLNGMLAHYCQTDLFKVTIVLTRFTILFFYLILLNLGLLGPRIEYFDYHNKLVIKY